jgi:hypothetical protein
MHVKPYGFPNTVYLKSMERLQFVVFNVQEQLQEQNNLAHVDKGFKFCNSLCVNMRNTSYATNI